MSERAQDWIHLRGFTFECIVGILKRERVQTQRLDVEVSLRLDLRGAAYGDLTRSVNYGHVLEQVQFIIQRGQWFLLESMAQAVTCWLLLPPIAEAARAQVDEVVLRLAKLDVFAGKAVPSIEVRRSSAWALEQASDEQHDRGISFRTVHETKHSSVYQVTLAPGQAWTIPEDAAAMLIGGELITDGAPRTLGYTLNSGADCAALERPVGLLVASKRPLFQKDAP